MRAWMKILIAAVLAGAVCAAVFLPIADEPAPPGPYAGAVAYVPLDDRPDNTDSAERLAAAAGLRLVMPARDLFSTRLDGMTANENNTAFGDREALFDWVRETDAGGCDIFVLSLDQLFSGGLVNSRAMTHGVPIEIDGEQMSEAAAFDAVILTLAADENNKIYLFDSVMRLASTVGYDGLGREEYAAVREYGALSRPLLSGSRLTLENIFAAYPLAADGITPAESLVDNPALTPQLIADYLAARERKTALCDHVMGAVRELENVTLFIGIDDSAGADSIQQNELDYISAALGENGALLSGLDSLGRLSLTRAACDLYGLSDVGVRVRCFGGGAGAPSCEYDRYTLRESVAAHLDAFGLSAAEDGGTELIILTAPTLEQFETETLICALEENEKAGVPTIFIDASAGAFSDLNAELLSRIDFGRLLAYCGGADQASIIGVGLAMGLSRAVYLAAAPEDDLAAAQREQLAASMINSMAYFAKTRYNVDSFIKNAGYDPDLIFAEGEELEAITARLDELLRADSAAILENIGGVELVSADFPWQRSFEISMELEAQK